LRSRQRLKAAVARARKEERSMDVKRYLAEERVLLRRSSPSQGWLRA
jgi:hypothetical protein